MLNIRASCISSLLTWAECQDNMVIYQHQKRQKGCVNEDNSNFHSSFDIGCLKFKFLDNTIGSCLSKSSNFG